MPPEYGTIISNSDDKFISEFCDPLNWDKINKQRECLEERDVQSPVNKREIYRKHGINVERIK